jgi:predicted TIM-barrel fold metal-dependent hydrolase
MKVLDFHLHYNGQLDDAQILVDKCQAAGIEKGVAFAVNFDDGSFTTVKQMADLAEKYSDFIIPFAYGNPGRHDCIAEIKEAAQAGFKGIKFLYPAKPYDDDEYFPIYEAAAKAGMVCLFHTGMVLGNIGKGGLHGVEFQKKWRVSADYMRPMRLDRIARSFPEMTIVGAHCGSEAYYEEATSMFHWQTNVYMDMSIGQFHWWDKSKPDGSDESLPIKSRIMDLRNSGQLDLNRILFGTDAVLGNPEASPDYGLRTLRIEMEGLNATDEEKENVAWNTAARILGLE